jgi:hypothetical protein
MDNDRDGGVASNNGAVAPSGGDVWSIISHDIMDEENDDENKGEEAAKVISLMSLRIVLELDALLMVLLLRLLLLLLLLE